MNYPNQADFLKGCQEFEKHEKRDAMYRVATFLVSHYWGQPPSMANGLGVLLLTWNQAFYRYGVFDFDKLEDVIIKYLPILEEYRSRDIFSLSISEERVITNLFNKFLEALRVVNKSGKIRRSPVAVAKTLHLLAPHFFPIWDKKIACAYGCNYDVDPEKKYFKFCEITRCMASEVKGYIITSDKSLLKRIDEYNYSKYTKGWI